MSEDPNVNLRQQTAEKIINIEHADSIHYHPPFSLKRISRKQRKVLVFIIISILILSAVIAMQLSHLHNRKQYNELFNEAILQMKSMNTQKAVELFHTAARFATNKDEYVKARSFEGNCQFMCTYLDENTRYSYKTIQTIYSEILDNPKYEKCEYYYDVAAGMSNILFFSNYPASNQDWIDLVRILESRLVYFDTGRATSSDVMQLPTIYLSLANYYWRAFEPNNYSDSIIEIGDKALFYFSRFNELYNRIESDKMYTDMEHIVRTEIDFMCRYLSLALVTDSPSDYISQIIDFCDSLSFAFNSYHLSQYVYIQYKELCGKANLLGAAFEPNIEKAANMRQFAYDCFQSIVTMDTDYSESGETILYTCAYFIQTKLCTEEDLELIIELFKALFDSYPFDDMVTKIDDEVIVCMACKYAIECYGFHDYIYEYGKTLIEDVGKYREYITNELCETAAELFEYFS